MKNYFVLCIGLWLAACGSGGEKASENTGTIASAEEIDGMSIYQLTSTWETQDGQNLQLQDLEGEVLEESCPLWKLDELIALLLCG